MHDYRRLRVYQLAIQITSDVFELTATLPQSQRYGLAQQMNRAASSIAANIAEGAGRGDPKDFARFLRIARGSACELEAHLTVGHQLSMITSGQAASLRDRIEHAKASLTRLESTLH